MAIFLIFLMSVLHYFCNIFKLRYCPFYRHSTTPQHR